MRRETYPVHCHETEETFFILGGACLFASSRVTGAELRLGKWTDCVPALRPSRDHQRRQRDVHVQTLLAKRRRCVRNTATPNAEIAGGGAVT